MKTTTEDMGTLDDSGDRSRLRFERTLAHPIERVWRMITEPEGLAKWFPARVEYEAFEVGARVTFTFGAADVERAREAGVEGVPEVSTGVIREIDPPRVFELDWLGEPIRFELAPEGYGCRLSFTHVFDRDEAQAPRNAAGWHVCLEALDAALADAEKPSEARVRELQNVYVAAFRTS